jgi:hypothetical protein
VKKGRNQQEKDPCCLSPRGSSLGSVTAVITKNLPFFSTRNKVLTGPFIRIETARSSSSDVSVRNFRLNFDEHCPTTSCGLFHYAVKY